jgi:hypothetical protein
VRRVVRLTEEFFASLDLALPAERTDTLPSRRDFEVTDLLAIVERFADQWDNLPPLVPGRGDYRQLISSGHLMLTFVVEGQLARDGAVELVSIEIDTEGI